MKYADEEIIGTRSGRSISPQFELECQEIICQALVELMTEKGLYQNININYEDVVTSAVEQAADQYSRCAGVDTRHTSLTSAKLS